MSQPKSLRGVYAPGAQYWVGDGFWVRNLFPSNPLQRELDPFLLLDYAGPTYFPPAPHPRGVGEHPHRGFETVTIVYQGELAHRDSSGTAGVVGAGAVQWMTAGAGVVHEEMHSAEFSRKGGTLQAVQLWVNLPRRAKMAPAAHQLLDAIPEAAFDGGVLRVIAGSYLHNGEMLAGAARTHTPIELYDVRLQAGASLTVPLAHRHTAAVFVAEGQLEIEGRQATEANLAVFHSSGDAIQLTARADSKFLVLSGEPIDEPIVSHGPFVMNSREELLQAVEDYRSGRMGRLSG
jgi:redox-sensitive bicupin YhaK (pirin superfamily)